MGVVEGSVAFYGAQDVVRTLLKMKKDELEYYKEKLTDVREKNWSGWLFCGDSNGVADASERRSARSRERFVWIPKQSSGFRGECSAID